MKIKSLTIKAKETWETSDFAYIGKILLESENSTQEFNLSALAISNLFDQIKKEVAQTARVEAERVATGIENSIVGLTLEGKSSINLLEADGDHIPF